LQISIPRVTTGIFVLLFAACSNTRTLTFVNGMPVPPFDRPIVQVSEDASLDAPVSGYELTFAWQAMADFPLEANSTGLMLRLADGTTLPLNLRQPEELLAPFPSDSSQSLGQLLHIERSIGTCTMRIDRQARDATSNGTFQLSFNKSAIDDLRQSGWQPTGRQCLRLLVNDTSADAVLAYRRVDPEVSLNLAMHLVRYEVASDQYRTFAAVTDFDDDEVIKLLHNSVDLQVPIDWHAIGRDLTATQIIYCKHRDIAPNLARAWQDAKTDLTIEQIYWAKVRDVTPAEHTAWQQAGSPLSLKNLYWAKVRDVTPANHTAWQLAGNPLSLENLYWVAVRDVQPITYSQWHDAGFELDHEQLYWAQVRDLRAATWRAWQQAGKPLKLAELYEANNYGLDPKECQAWRDLGQELSLSDLRTAKNYGVRATVAGAWRELGFRWSIADLTQLRNYSISPQFAARFVDPRFENPTLKELIRYHQMDLEAEEVNKLRKRRRGTQPR